jgi:hypothetical protein
VAALYVEARELHGGLLRIEQPVASWFELVETEMRTILTKESLLVLREHVMEHAIARVNASAAVANAWHALCGPSPPAEAAALRTQLKTRYFNMRANAFKRETMEAVGVATMSVRAALKACMVHEAAKGKKSLSKAKAGSSAAHTAELVAAPAAVHQ